MHLVVKADGALSSISEAILLNGEIDFHDIPCDDV
jgi:hypothetical protein